MTEQLTPYGRLIVGTQEELFAQAVVLAEAQRVRARARHFTWALTGGSTPKAWYKWCVAQQALPVALREAAHFTVSDERHVPLASDDSNFGHAERGLFAPLGIPTDRRHPWVVAWPVAEAAEAYRRTMTILAPPGLAYEVCFLGMGDDCHTASIFPGSPLLKGDDGLLFGHVEVPGKGWRLTITPAGLRACGTIVVMALGASKAPALKRVLQGPYNPSVAPSQLLRESADRVTWLVDAAAAAQL